ncbi:MAG: bifunctional diguanylate cyclase/phosphodiesterase [Pseudomonadota bacterium]
MAGARATRFSVAEAILAPERKTGSTAAVSEEPLAHNEDIALPSFRIRTLGLAKLAANAAGVEAALIDMGETAGPIVFAPDDDYADRIAAAWRAPSPDETMVPLLANYDSTEPFAVGVTAPLRVGGRRGFVAIIAEPSMAPAFREHSVLELVRELAADWDRQQDANALWTDRQFADREEVQLMNALFRAGTMRGRGADELSEASDRARDILGLPNLVTMDDVLDSVSAHDRIYLRSVLAGEQGIGPITYEFDMEVDGKVDRGIRMRIAFEAEGTESGLTWRAALEDVTQERQQLAELRTRAERDRLTGVYNESQFSRTLADAIEEAKHHREHVGLVLVSIDSFHELDALVGRAASDSVVRFVARAITNLVRSTDTVVRLGRADFGVILARAADEGGLVSRALKIRDALATQVNIGDSSVAITASLGFAVYPQDTDLGVDLYAAASHALGETVSGLAMIRRYDRKARQRHDDEKHLMEDIRRGIEADEFVPYFQPKVDLESGAVVGFEALCRWQHPTRGLLTPGAFLSALESTTVGMDLSNVSLFGSFEAARAFKDMSLAFGHIAVNLSAAQLAKPGLALVVSELQERFGVTCDEISFEVLENVLMRDKTVVCDNLDDLWRAGFRISLDDFGTGFASLTHIRKPFIDEVKIDRSFVMDAGTSPNDQQIVAAIVQMARKLNLHMVAEGIEDEDTLAKLRALGCTTGQGFVFAPALPFSEAAEFLGRQNRIFNILGAAGRPSPLDPDPRTSPVKPGKRTDEPPGSADS